MSKIFDNMNTTELLKNHTPKIRFLYDLKDVLCDREWLRKSPNFEVYYMYRDLAGNEVDKEKITMAGLRYDITVMSPTMLGKEFPKTYGHEHAQLADTGLTYPEIYEILSGEAHYLLQKRRGAAIENIIIIHAKQGDKILIPPNYGHVTINTSGQELKMANWLEKTFASDYSIFQKKHGAGYYGISEANFHLTTKPARLLPFGSEQLNKSAPQKIEWLKNPHYDSVPEAQILAGSDYSKRLEKFGLDIKKEMYHWIEDIDKLDFLKTPQNYEWK